VLVALLKTHFDSYNWPSSGALFGD